MSFNRLALALRTVAVLIAVAGVVDPAFAVRRRQPVPIEVRTSPSAGATSVRDRLTAALGAGTVAGTGVSPVAIVVIGDAALPARFTPGVPVSVVSLTSGPGVRIVRTGVPGLVLPGQQTLLTAELEATHVAGTSSTIDLEQDGLRLARVEHRWTADRERFTARLEYSPPAAGLTGVRIVARPADGQLDDSNLADLPLEVTQRILRVASYEPRPSWTSGFVRRALETDPVFAVASLVRSSRNIEVRAGATPARLTASSLAAFDVVIVGAPEELNGRDVDALDEFMRQRGGVVVLLPDRAPSGPFVKLIPGAPFDDALLEKPVPLTAGAIPSGLSASEFALPRRVEGAGVVMASIRSGGVARAAIASWPRGAGRVVYSGALDGWRSRAANEDAFSRFWTSLVANAAMAAPPRLAMTANPAVAAPGEQIAVRARFRATELTHEPGRLVVPPIEAAIVAADGSRTPLRLWPGAEPGTYEGLTIATAPGQYRIEAAGGPGVEAAAEVIVARGVRHPPEQDNEGLRLIADSTGGVVVDSTDLEPLVRHVRAMKPKEELESLHPMRSPAWSVLFAGVLCGEWIVRRRRGDR